MTNGPTWNEYLSAFMGTDLFNHAYSGATANNTILPRAVPDVSEQIQEFHTSCTSFDDQETLYIIWTGVNDVHDIYVATSNITEQNILLDNIIESIANEMKRLPHEHLLVLGLAPIQHLPLFTQHLGTSDALSSLIDTFNDKLRALAQGVIRFIDTRRLFEKYFTLQDTDGFADITQACIRDFKQCLSSKFNYIWWDDWHPSTATHQLLAADLYDILHNTNLT
ncbi:GDSL lipase/esterase [Zychaea mexicana]|uniref:GDSL lipase/esterase n=1 Tax=Zychaea mexicana TaxID=64656 RepID=UPI0022FDB9CC|nr:GDSL lipase/esterase [Zychaea mexicana]KAI9497181.1 GDSL lipase/esterase [Zychaea mexicana]